MNARSAKPIASWRSRLWRTSWRERAITCCGIRSPSMWADVSGKGLAEGGEPRLRTGVKPPQMIWTPLLRHRIECRLMNRPSVEPQKDWRRPQGDSHWECEHPPWTSFGTKVSLGWQKPPGRSQNIAASLIPTGVWCDSLRNQQHERTGAVAVCRNEGGERRCTVLAQSTCDVFVLPLTTAG